MKTASAIVCVILICTTSALADRNTGKGQGAIVIADEAPVYKDSTGDTLAYFLGEEGRTKKLVRGDVVGGVTITLRSVDSYQFHDAKGRVQVLVLNKGNLVNGWMNPSDLSYFTYECGCGLANAKCSPHVLERFHWRWNICFEEARDKKLAEMNSSSAPASAAVTPSESVEVRLQKLSDLYKKGLITQQDYEKKKAEILNSM